MGLVVGMQLLFCGVGNLFGGNISCVTMATVFSIALLRSINVCACVFVWCVLICVVCVCVCVCVCMRVCIWVRIRDVWVGDCTMTYYTLATHYVSICGQNSSTLTAGVMSYT